MDDGNFTKFDYKQNIQNKLKPIQMEVSTVQSTGKSFIETNKQSGAVVPRDNDVIYRNKLEVHPAYFKGGGVLKKT